MTHPKGYQPEGVKYTYPDDDPYQEGNEVYYNMAEFLNDDEFHQIWEIVGKACDRHGIPTDGDQELSVRLYDTLEENIEHDMEHIDLSLEENAEWDNSEVMEED